MAFEAIFIFFALPQAQHKAKKTKTAQMPIRYRLCRFWE